MPISASPQTIDALAGSCATSVELLNISTNQVLLINLEVVRQSDGQVVLSQDNETVATTFSTLVLPAAATLSGDISFNLPATSSQRENFTIRLLASDESGSVVILSGSVSCG